MRRISVYIMLVFFVIMAFTVDTFAQNTKANLNTQVSTSFPDNTSGLITPAITRTFFNNQIASWQQFAGVNSQNGVSYTIALTDYGQIVSFNNGSAVAVTVPQATGSFATFNAYIKNVGAGTVTLTPQTSTINGAANFAVLQGQQVWIVSDGTNYQVWGAVVGLASANVWTASNSFSSEAFFTGGPPQIAVQPAASTTGSQVSLNANGNAQSSVLFSDLGTASWQLGVNNPGKDFFIFDSVGAQNMLDAASNGNLTISPKGGTTSVTGALTTSGALTANGALAANAGATVTTSFTATGLVTNADLANMAGSTFKMNPTTSAAAPTDQTIDGLTLKGTPAGADELILWDVAGAAIKKATVTSVQGAASAVTLLNTLTASNSATLSDTTSLTSTYSSYLIVLNNFVPVTTSTALELQVHSGGAFQTTTYVSSTNVFIGTAATSGTTCTTCVQFSTAVETNDAGIGLIGAIWIGNPSNTTTRKLIRGEVQFNDGGTWVTALGGGYWNGGNGAVDGFQVFYSSGNISTGTLKVYGIQ